jgi:hypothetical protein
MTHSQETPFSVGRYLLTPFTKLTEAGHYIANVSIRNGKGRSSHDRIFRFTPTFDCAQSALAYARHEGFELARQA